MEKDDANISTLPQNMSLNDTKINQTHFPDTFAHFFKTKIEDIIINSRIDIGIYNRVRKIVVFT